MHLTNKLSTHHTIHALHQPTIHASHHPCILPYKHLTNQLFNKYHTIHGSQQPTVQASYHLNSPHMSQSMYLTTQPTVDESIYQCISPQNHPRISPSHHPYINNQLFTHHTIYISPTNHFHQICSLGKRNPKQKRLTFMKPSGKHYS